MFGISIKEKFTSLYSRIPQLDVNSDAEFRKKFIKDVEILKKEILHLRVIDFKPEIYRWLNFCNYLVSVEKKINEKQINSKDLIQGFVEFHKMKTKEMEELK